MNIKFRNLENISFEEIHQAFVDAFSDYAVDVSYMTPDVMYHRAIKNGYEPEASVGVFNGRKMVGFTLVGIDKHYEVSAAFDIITGLVKGYRGKGIAAEMFNFIKPTLKEKEIEEFYLEVLQENVPAIRAYQKTGFKIIRSLDCFALPLEKFRSTEEARIPLIFKIVDKSEIDEFETFSDWIPSWENSFNAIKRIPDEVVIISAEYSINKVGLLVYYPMLNWIMAFLVDPKYRKMGIGSAMLKELIDQLNGRVDKIKFTNIQSDDEDLINFLKASGFEWVVAQFEMKYELN
ncbi:MAG: GNAT family N-acetyltransferase [Bacteroidales bacterium]